MAKPDYVTKKEIMNLVKILRKDSEEFDSCLDCSDIKGTVKGLKNPVDLIKREDELYKSGALNSYFNTDEKGNLKFVIEPYTK